MVELGLNQSRIESIVTASASSILARGGSRDKPELLADMLQHALRDVARAIADNNKRIAEQLEKAGVVITQ